MTEKNFEIVMATVGESIKKNGNLKILRDSMEVNGKITDEAALKLFIKDSTSKAVHEFLDNQELQRKPVTDSVAAWDDIEGYYVVGSDCTSSFGDDVMSYVFEDLYCISTTGKLFKYRVLNVSGILLDYENTLSLSIEPYNNNVIWYANLNELTKAEESPLHRYHQFFVD